MSIKTDLKNLKEKDMYSLILFAIYRCTGDPHYSTLSELIYTLDRDNLLKFCSVFGGTTIKVPTTEELKIFANGLLIYDLTSQGLSLSEAWDQVEMESKYKKDILQAYQVICDIIKNYV